MILLFGHNGVIGGSLLRHLAVTGRDVLGVSSEQCDLTSPQAVKRYLSAIEDDFDVINCAVINRHRCQDYNAFADNCRMVQNMLEGMPVGRCRSMIHLSSVDVYGANPPCPITEQTMPHPDSYYALAKYTCERLIRMYPSRSFPVALLRLPGVYGPEDGGKSLIGNFIGKVLRGEGVTLFGSGQVRRDYCALQDLVSLVDSLLETPWDGVVNVVTGKSLSLCEILDRIALTSRCVPDVRLEEVDGDIASGDLVFHSALLENLWPHCVMRSMEQGIAEYVTAIRSVYV